MISFILSDSEDTVTYELYEVPFSDEEINDGEKAITTLDGNIYVDFIYEKRVWTREFAFMKEADYLRLRGFVDRQRTTYKFPLFSIPDFNIHNVAVYLQISERKTTNACGDVVDVKITMRETVQQ